MLGMKYRHLISFFLILLALIGYFWIFPADILADECDIMKEEQCWTDYYGDTHCVGFGATHEKCCDLHNWDCWQACFPAETGIKMEDGKSKNIEDIKVGDKPEKPLTNRTVVL